MQHDAKHLRFLRASLCARIFWIVGEALRFLSPLPLSPVLPVSLWLRKKSFWARWCPSSLFQLRSVCIYTESHWHHMWCCTSCTNFTDVCHWTPTPTRTQTDKSSLIRTATSWSICSAPPVVSPNLLHYHAWIFIWPKQQSCWFSNLLWGKKKKSGVDIRSLLLLSSWWILGRIISVIDSAFALLCWHSFTATSERWVGSVFSFSLLLSTSSPFAGYNMSALCGACFVSFTQWSLKISISCLPRGTVY